jgi:hypothetical protein
VGEVGLTRGSGSAAFGFFAQPFFVAGAFVASPNGALAGGPFALAGEPFALAGFRFRFCFAAAVASVSGGAS